MQPAGYENGQGIISAAYLKDVADPQWASDAGMKEFLTFLEKDFSGRQQARRLGHRRIRRCPDPGTGAEAMR